MFCDGEWDFDLEADWSFAYIEVRIFDVYLFWAAFWD